jgi:hypothetical protein
MFGGKCPFLAKQREKRVTVKQHVMDNAKDYPLLASRLCKKPEKGTTVVKDFVLANAKDYPTLAASMGH